MNIFISYNEQLTERFQSWQKDNGLDYSGWWKFLLKRWLRRHKLGWTIPFDYVQDDYDDGIQTLYVRRWGCSELERWRWPSYRDVGILDRLKDSGVTSRRQLYAVIGVEARKI